MGRRSGSGWARSGAPHSTRGRAGSRRNLHASHRDGRAAMTCAGGDAASRRATSRSPRSRPSPEPPTVMRPDDPADLDVPLAPPVSRRDFVHGTAASAALLALGGVPAVLGATPAGRLAGAPGREAVLAQIAAQHDATLAHLRDVDRAPVDRRREPQLPAGPRVHGQARARRRLPARRGRARRPARAACSPRSTPARRPGSPST